MVSVFSLYPWMEWIVGSETHFPISEFDHGGSQSSIETIDVQARQSIVAAFARKAGPCRPGLAATLNTRAIVVIV